MLLRSEQFEKFTYWRQFSLQDEDAGLNIETVVWAGSAVDDMIDVTPGMLHVATFRVGNLPILIELHDEEPDELWDAWNHITEAAIDIPSGCIVIFAVDYFPDAPRMRVEPGMYRARIFYGGFDTVSEDRETGEDHYKVALWRGEYLRPRVMKRRDAKYRLAS